ncbi:MAG: alpha/beta hydrolase [Propionibacteriaceae bacterium]|jgi:acetyl esterase|nr:alpha/beta hydrolase [Propionibacteriaceae bacterium]
MPIDAKIVELMTPVMIAQAPHLDPSNPAPHAVRRQAMAELRQTWLEGLGYPSYPDLAETEETVPTEVGPVRVRLFTPPTPAPRPGYLFFFGGGFWQSSFDGLDIVDACRQAASEAGVTVVEIDYPLAPEQPYPAAVLAGAAVLQWMADEAGRLGLDPDRLAIGGQSSGGNLAAATALHVRDHGGPALKLQILEVPALDLTGGHLSPVPGSAPAPTPVEFEDLIRAYGVLDKLTEPYVSPLLAPDLSGLPPALVLAAEYDPLRGDAEAYGHALRAAGVPVVQATFSGQVHASPALRPAVPAADAWRAMVSHALRRWV